MPAEHAVGIGYPGRSGTHDQGMGSARPAFHWSLVVCFVVAWVTGDELQRLHELAGYTIVGLLGVRIIWGFVGTAHAGFTDFVYRPSVALYYSSTPSACAPGDTSATIPQAVRWLSHSC